MKISISNIAWKNEEETNIAQLLPTMGVHGVDIAYTKFWATPYDAPSEALQEYRAFWAKQGIQIIGMQSLIYGRPDLILFGDPSVRDQMAQYLSDVFRLAGQLGARLLVFGSPKNRLKGDLSETEAMNIAVEFFGKLAGAAQRENVILCIEPNPPAYGCDFIQTTASALKLVQQVDHPSFRLHLDAAIMTMNGEDIDKALESAIEVLAHFHVSEPHLGVIGEGTVDHARFAKCLRFLNYQGWVAIEMRNGWRVTDIEAVRSALTYSWEIYGD
jgi:D-psicose/D-tagatose/L-ribulose 3-epimerase